MKAKELLSIDFSKYKKVAINSVITTDVKIIAQIDTIGTVSLLGLIDDKLILTAHYEADDEIETWSDEEGYMSISRR